MIYHILQVLLEGHLSCQVTSCCKKKYLYT